MGLCARLPELPSLNITWSEVWELPVDRRDRMLEQLGEWRRQTSDAYKRASKRR